MDIFDVSGTKIRQMREDMNWSRAELSEFSGVPERTIQDVETGITKNPSIDTFKAIIKAFPKPANEPSRNQLLGALISVLTTLDERQLGDVLDSIAIYSASRALVDAPLANERASKFQIANSNKKRKG